MNSQEARCPVYNSENKAGTHIGPFLRKGKRMNHAASEG